MTATAAHPEAVRPPDAREVPRPPAVRGLTGLLATTAAATIAVDLLNWWYVPEQGGFAVRSGWALLRSLGFLILIWHVRGGRSGAKPFGLILAVTTVFVVSRRIVPCDGVPPLPGVLGFATLAAAGVTGYGLWRAGRAGPAEGAATGGVGG